MYPFASMSFENLQVPFATGSFHGADLIQLADIFIAGGAQQVAFDQLILLEEWHHLLHLQSKVLALPIENSWVSGPDIVTPLLVVTSLESTQASNKGQTCYV